VRELPHFSTPSALIVLVMCHFHTPNGAPRMAKQHFVLMGNRVQTHTATTRGGDFGQVSLSCRCRCHRRSNFLFVKYFGNASLRILALDDGVKRCLHTRSEHSRASVDPRFLSSTDVAREKARERERERERESLSVEFIAHWTEKR